MARKEPQATPSENNSAGSVFLVSDDRRSMAKVIDLESEISKKPPTTRKATWVRNTALTERRKGAIGGQGDWQQEFLKLNKFKPRRLSD